MKNSKKTVEVLFALLCVLFYTNPTFAQQPKGDFKVTVKLDYGSVRASRDTVITSNRSLTALEALQYAAKVETNHVAQYVFITAVDDVKGIIGVLAWYYEINGQPATTLAINTQLKNGDIIRWIYKKDVCSGKAKCK
jgi:hypothetical protein